MVSNVLHDICYFVLPLKSWLSIGEWASLFYQILWLPCSCSGLLSTGRDYGALPCKSTGLEHGGLLPFVLQAIPATDVIEIHGVLAEILPFHCLHKLFYAFLVCFLTKETGFITSDCRPAGHHWPAKKGCSAAEWLLLIQILRPWDGLCAERNTELENVYPKREMTSTETPP